MSIKSLEGRVLRILKLMKIIIVIISLVFSANITRRAQAASSYETFQSAIIRVDRLISEDRLIFAQWWLRYAYQYAPNDLAKSRVQNLYSAIRNENPLAFKVSLSVNPSDNINNGGSEEVIWLGGLPFTIPPEDLRISGYSINTSIDGSYRLSSLSNLSSYLIFSAQNKNVFTTGIQNNSALSSIEANSFDSADYSAGIRWFFKAEPNQSLTDFTVSLGQVWYAGHKLSTWEEVSFGRVSPLSDAHSIRFSTSFRRTKRLDSSQNNSMGRNFSIGLNSRILDIGIASATLLYNSTASESNAISSETVSISGGFSFEAGRAIIPSILVSVEEKDFGFWESFGLRRVDVTAALSASLQFSDFELYGFNPKIGIEHSRTNSSVSAYDKNATNFGFYFSSVF